MRFFNFPSLPTAFDQTKKPSTSPLTLKEIEAVAKEKLPNDVHAFYASGSDNEAALAKNRDAFGRLCIRPRVLVDVSNVSTEKSLFGWTSPLPIGVAPSAMQKMAGGNGELDVANAVAAMGLNLTLSTNSTTSLEDVIGAQKNQQPGSGQLPGFWMQIYLYEDMERSVGLIKRAEAAGYEALVLTVDTPVLGNRLTERKTPLVLPPGMKLPNLDKSASGSPTSSKPSINRQLMDAKTSKEAKDIIKAAGGTTHSSSMTWATAIPFLRKTSSMKIILKGVMTGEDAARAVQHGVDAIIVSNHGGRQLDDACSTLEALPEIVAATRGSILVILDGGIRSGSDVFKSLALGADFVLIGRPILWGLAYKGREGVEETFQILERELSRTMALAGVQKIEDIKKECLGVLKRDGFGLAKL